MMDTDNFDPYVMDVLMPDLVGHDRSPAAFVVYLYLLGKATRAQRDTITASLQTIASDTGLSKSAVQLAVRRLLRRGLLDPAVKATSTKPLRRVLQPWVRDSP
jgi:hypothetical protein